MYNSDIPTRAELPSSARLIKSTVLALITATILLVTVVLPAEHAIDPTGIGRILKLTEMGQIKQQLAEEAANDRKLEQQKNPVPINPDKRSGLGSIFAHLLVSPAAAQTPLLITQATAKSDETTITLKPGEGVEYKLTMKKGDKVNFIWAATGGKVNYDMHGTPGSGKETSYKKERDVAGQEGTLEAAFDGGHGWFWRNRSAGMVTIILKTNGAYSEIKRMV